MQLFTLQIVQKFREIVVDALRASPTSSLNAKFGE